MPSAIGRRRCLGALEHATTKRTRVSDKGSSSAAAAAAAATVAADATAAATDRPLTCARTSALALTAWSLRNELRHGDPCESARGGHQ